MSGLNNVECTAADLHLQSRDAKSSLWILQNIIVLLPKALRIIIIIVS